MAQVRVQKVIVVYGAAGGQLFRVTFDPAKV
jgi:hypothetical protein